MKFNFKIKTWVLGFIMVSGAEMQAQANPLKFALGMERRALVGGTSLNNLHGKAELVPGGWAGIALGIDNDFDVFHLAGDFKYDLIKTAAAGFFVRAELGFVKGTQGVSADPDADTSGISAATLMGFEYALTTNLKASFAYGFQYLFGYGANHFGITNNDAFGNFGMHWFF